MHSGLEVAMAATHRLIPETHSEWATAGGPALFVFLREGQGKLSRPHGQFTACFGRMVSPVARLRWVVMALEGVHGGLSPSAAMREADARVNGAAEARQELLALLSSLASPGADQSLPALLRRRVLAELAAGLQRLVRLPLERALRQLRSRGS
jgi:hypothetical protein